MSHGGKISTKTNLSQSTLRYPVHCKSLKTMILSLIGFEMREKSIETGRLYVFGWNRSIASLTESRLCKILKMNNFIWLIGLCLAIWWLFSRWRRPGVEASEALQRPALRHDELPWTKLDQLVLNVARHDVLALWHSDERQLWLDTPVYDVNVDGGWNVTSDDFGQDIGNRYEQLFPVLCAMPSKQRNAVLRAAEAKSREARLKVRDVEIRHPDGTVHEFPSWMIHS